MWRELRIQRLSYLLEHIGYITQRRGKRGEEKGREFYVVLQHTVKNPLRKLVGENDTPTERARVITG